MQWYFSSGDLGFFWEEQIRAFSWLPQVTNGLLSLWLDYPFRVVVKILSTVGFSWFVIEKLLWISVFALACYSSYKLTKHWLGCIIYTFNTYLLLLFSGGQLGVAASFAFTPFIFYRFREHPKEKIVNGLYLAILIIFDIRIAFLVILATAPWWYRSIVSLIVAGSLHMYWILPTVLARATIPGELTNPGMLKFLSFTDFSHALSLLHPNWPENLFGKVYFLQPEFLIIPILAFSAVANKYRYFAFLALIGVFFAKGVNEPFGGIFQWMFERVPGFVMFRDPTKFYLYIAMGYSVLIPVILKKSRLLSILFVIFWLFTLRGFSIQPVRIPEEYVQLKNLLVSDPIPSRTLWIPKREGFAFSSDVHPILTATDAASVDPSVKYIIVPIDVNKKIFLDGYEFNPSMREKVIASISLPQNPQFQDLAVFENPSFSGMQSAVPAVATKQQQLANIGLGISAAFLILWTFLR